MLRVDILRENEYQPVFYHDGKAVSPADGIRILRESIIKQQSVGAMEATQIMAARLGKSRSGVLAWMQGKYLSTDSLLRIKFVFDL